MSKVNLDDIKSFLYAGGEISVDISDISYSYVTQSSAVEVKAILRCSEDIIKLLMVCNAIKQSCLGMSIILDLPYIPYGRNDRVSRVGEALGIKVMADLINSIGAKKVKTLDPHSDVTTALINNLEVSFADDLIAGIVSSLDDHFIFVAPDSGAEKKVYSCSNLLGRPFITATKHRDPVTGYISHTTIHDVEDYANYLVIDDICDGGRTFIELAKKMKEKNIGKLYLYVTHGIFSKGIEELLKYYDKIYCCYTFDENLRHENLIKLYE